MLQSDVYGQGKANRSYGAGPWDNCFAHMNSFNPHNSPSCAGIIITPNFIDRKSSLRNLFKVILLVSGIQTQDEPPYPMHLTIQHMALATDKGRLERAQPRA